MRRLILQDIEELINSKIINPVYKYFHKRYVEYDGMACHLIDTGIGNIVEREIDGKIEAYYDQYLQIILSGRNVQKLEDDAETLVFKIKTLNNEAVGDTVFKAGALVSGPATIQVDNTGRFVTSINFKLSVFRQL